MLMPAAVLVLVLLAGVTVDLSLLWLGEREVANAAMAAANDAAGMIDEAVYRETGEVEVRCDVAQEVAEASFTARRPDWLRHATVDVVECGGGRVRVDVTGEVGFVFSRGVPGAADTGHVAASGAARAERR